MPTSLRLYSALNQYSCNPQRNFTACPKPCMATRRQITLVCYWQRNCPPEDGTPIRGNGSSIHAISCVASNSTHLLIDESIWFRCDIRSGVLYKWNTIPSQAHQGLMRFPVWVSFFPLMLATRHLSKLPAYIESFTGVSIESRRELWDSKGKCIKFHTGNSKWDPCDNNAKTRHHYSRSSLRTTYVAGKTHPEFLTRWDPGGSNQTYSSTGLPLT
jgi:hypothetical protein